MAREKVVGLVLMAALFFGGTGAAYANIGENFAAAGVVLSGSAGARTYLGYLDNLSFNLVHLWVSPGLDFLVARNLSVDVSASASATIDVGPYSSGLRIESLSLDLGVSYYFCVRPEAAGGTVPALSLFAGVSRWLDSYGYPYLSAYLYPSLTLYFFVTDRLAPYVALTALYLHIPPSAVDAWLDPSATVGMSFWLPSADRVLGGRK